MTSKQELREQVWSELERVGADRFPGARGRIPNFKGAEAAADLLAATGAWQAARTIKTNPDSPQRPVRQSALRDGKRVYMAVPRLRKRKCFLELNPDHLADEQLHRASTIKGSSELGRPVEPGVMPSLDLVVAGSVAVDHAGGRIGKGGGYSDLEFALAWEAGLLAEGTPIVTTVHEIQVLAGPLPQEEHDLRLSMIVTPSEVIRCPGAGRGSAGILWELLSDEKIEAIPALRDRWAERAFEGDHRGR